MSTPTEENNTSTSNEEVASPDFGEPRKMADETFDTEDESDHSGAEQEEEGGEGEELAVEDAAIDILDQLVELFVEKNGREPNQEEVMQWIDVFKSLQIDGGDEANKPAENEQVEEEEETPVASE